jgi:hypothetical protein
MCLGIFYNAFAQQAPAEGTLKDAEFIIEKERKLSLPEASRLFEQAPAMPLLPEPIKPLRYALPTLFPVFDILPLKTKILRAKQEGLAQLYGNLLKAGHGNFHTPYLEVFFANKRNPTYGYGLHIQHLSAGEKVYGEEAHNLVQLHGTLFTKTLRLGAEACYSRDGYQLYDSENDATATPPQQILQQFGIRKTLRNYNQETLNYQIEASFHHLADGYKARESQWGFNSKGDYDLNDLFTNKASTNLYLTHHCDEAVKTNRNLWRIRPLLAIALDDFDIEGGINLVYQNDPSPVVSEFNIYPAIEVKYALHKWLRPYLGISGNMQQNSLQSFLQENPFLAANTTLRHTNQRFLFYGGAKGDVMHQISYHAGLSVATYQNLHCFLNNAENPGRFDVCYDPKTTLINTFGELAHTNQTEALTVRLRGDHFHYMLKELERPWHRPRYQLAISSGYRLYDKIIFKGSAYWLGGMEALDVTSNAPIRLNSVVDLGVGIDYLWSARFSIFLDCKNILAHSHERYLHYSARRFHFVAGLTYAW